VKLAAASVLTLACFLMAAPGFARNLVASLDSEHAITSDAPLTRLDWYDDYAQQQPAQPPAAEPTTPATQPPAEPGPGELMPLPDLPSTGGQPLGEEVAPEDEFNPGDIPNIETVELELEKSKKALEIYVLVREKYKDAALENYENLQDFVDKDPQGKAFDTDVKGAGFKDVNEWNNTVTSLSFAYANAENDQTTELLSQIKEIEADTEIAVDMRSKMVAAIKALIPSDNNKKIIEELKKDTVALEKLKLLESESE
jgi:flagellar hook-basal body complex protein FliE